MKWLGIALFALAVLATAPTGEAQGRRNGARGAVESGDTRPLGEILPRVRSQYPGQLLDAQLVRRGGRPVYQLRILGSGGRVQVLSVDARTAEILGVRGGGR